MNKQMNFLNLRFTFVEFLTDKSNIEGLPSSAFAQLKLEQKQALVSAVGQIVVKGLKEMHPESRPSQSDIDNAINFCNNSEEIQELIGKFPEFYLDNY